MKAKPVLLLILDGWGHRDEREYNAIAHAQCPNWRHLLAAYPHALVETHGLAVGLPEGQMGNSEVGHMTIGAGRVIYQDLTRIDQSIADGAFRRNPALVRAAQAAAAQQSNVLHLFGLLSPGGVHSHERHIFEMIRLSAEQGAKRIAVHAFLDGRDTPPQSAEASLRALDAVCAQTPGAYVATVGGRYYAMDRDRRWERVAVAYEAMVNANSSHRAEHALDALAQAYARGETDEFVKPTVIAGHVPMQSGDAAAFMNFRADRARQLTAAFVQESFDAFPVDRALRFSTFVTMTEYSADLPVTAIAYPPQSMRNTLPEYLAKAGLRQLRIAETEKYAHVTFFFNGGQETPFAEEERILVPSPKVATYDLQPEMSCPEVTEKLCAAIRSGRYDFILCNLANPDMVGHTGVFGAAVKAVEAVDAALGKIGEALRAAGGEMIVTADHGNLELMRDEENGQAHTQHTVGPVPMVYVGRPARLESGGLQDIAPSVLYLLGLRPPTEMTGKSLIRPL